MLQLIGFVFMLLVFNIQTIWLCKRWCKEDSSNTSQVTPLSTAFEDANFKLVGQSRQSRSASKNGKKISPTISGTKTAKKIAQHKKSKVNKEPANDDTIKLVGDIKTAIEENKKQKHTARTYQSADKHDLHSTIEILPGKLENDIEVKPEVDLKVIDPTADFPIIEEMCRPTERFRGYSTPDAFQQNGDKSNQSEKNGDSIRP
ncbi:hypothetical protein M3Y97_00067100 [Aphelenchoides bicaudatus]|nr:hypothetical protein M3Y97_00067100 [Aphelenchoides bicaudatus]